MLQSDIGSSCGVRAETMGERINTFKTVLNIDQFLVRFKRWNYLFVKEIMRNRDDLKFYCCCYSYDYCV